MLKKEDNELFDDYYKTTYGLGSSTTSLKQTQTSRQPRPFIKATRLHPESRTELIRNSMQRLQKLTDVPNKDLMCLDQESSSRTRVFKLQQYAYNSQTNGTGDYLDAASGGESQLLAGAYAAVQTNNPTPSQTFFLTTENNYALTGKDVETA